MTDYTKDITTALEEETSLYQAFQGPNGWYVAWVGDSGFHRQPLNGGTMSERAARKEAIARNRAMMDDHEN